jgi:outer membrane protein OmpA-like peptidoglycan-associated protein
LWLLFSWLRRKLVLQRLPVRHRPEFASLDAESGADRLFQPGLLRRTAAALRRPSSQTMVELDVERSVEAAARGAGLSPAVYGARRAMPEYLALIERRSAEDHQARLQDELLGRLRELGVTIEPYYFSGDPRACFGPRSSADPERLGDVLARHHRATLLLFAEADRLISPVTGRPEPWVDTMSALARRVLLTSEDPYNWAGNETAVVASGFAVVESEEEALTAYAERDNTWSLEQTSGVPYARPFPRSLIQQPDLAFRRQCPPPPVLERLVRELKGYLGPRDFVWLAACAVYPEIDWPLTLYLADTAGDVDLRARFRPLSRLPWFRFGFMPDWLRTTLITQLDHQQETMVRRRLAERLEALARQASDLSGTSALRIAGWVGTPLDLATTAPEGSPMRDPVFVGYMAGARLAAPTVDAPSALRRLFGRLGVLPATGGVQRARRTWAQRLAGRLRAWVVYRPATTGVVLSLVLGAGCFGVLRPMLNETVVTPVAVPKITVAVSPDGKRVVAASGAYLVEADPTQSKPVSGGPQAAAIREVAFRPDGTLVVTADASEGLYVTELPPGLQVFRQGLTVLDGMTVRGLLRRHGVTTPAAVVRLGGSREGVPNDARFFAVTVGATVYTAWFLPGTARQPPPISAVDAFTIATSRLAHGRKFDISADGTLLAAIDDTNEITLHLTTSKSDETHQLTHPEVNVPQTLSLSADGKRIAFIRAGSGSNEVVIADTTSFQQIAKMPLPGAVSVSLNGDGHVPLVVTDHTAEMPTAGAWIWDLQSRAFVLVHSTETPISGAISHDGRVVAVYDNRQIATYLIEVPEPKPPEPIASPTLPTASPARPPITLQAQVATCDPLAPVYFEVNKSVLSDQSIRALQHHAKCIQQHPDWDFVDLVAHVDPRGDQMLSDRKAQAVKSYLEKLGVGSVQLNKVPRGGIDPVCLSDSVSCRARNERVDFEIHKRPPPILDAGVAHSTTAPSAPTSRTVGATESSPLSSDLFDFGEEAATNARTLRVLPPEVGFGEANDRTNHAPPALRERVREQVRELLKHDLRVRVAGVGSPDLSDFVIDGAITRLDFNEGGTDVEAICAVELILSRQRPSRRIETIGSAEATVQRAHKSYKPTMREEMEREALDSAVKEAYDTLARYIASSQSRTRPAPPPP